MLRDPRAHGAAPDPSGVVLTCVNPGCRRSYEPSPGTVAARALACPDCDSPAMTAGLDEPTPTRSEPTPAQQHAAFLRALADHLDAHPDLATPEIISTSRQLQIGDRGRGPGALIAWFRSVGARDLRVDLFPDYASVRAVNVRIGDQTADVWGGVEGLQKLLIQGGGYSRLPFTLAELEHFAEYGTLPEAGGR